MRPRTLPRRVRAVLLAVFAAFVCLISTSRGGEPDAARYWKVEDIRPGMKGTGQTVMVGTKLEEFRAEVLGVMRDVSPGRDMILCRLSGCDLDHSGVIQGMSGSPIYVDGKLLGAVAFAWEFAKDPIAGVTPFQQMVEYVRSSDRRIAAESKDIGNHAENFRQGWGGSNLIAGLGEDVAPVESPSYGGMRAIATPLAATGFTPRALTLLDERLRPFGMTPMAGGAAAKRVVEEEGNKPLVPGSPLSIAMVMGDFDLSGIGTVTHVEGDRVYGFGHPMFGLGSCDFPMMALGTHTVYPRASVSMKMGSPLKVVGVVDTDVSTGVAGRLGGKPDMLPVSVRVKTGRYADPHTYRVQMVREPSLLPNLVMAVLTNAIDTEGSLPEELTARVKATIKVRGHDPVEINDTLSGPRFAGPTGPSAMFGPIASVVNILTRNPMAKIRIEAVDCDVEISPGRTVASVESVRLASDRLEPGQTLKADVTLKPFKGDRRSVTIELPLPDDLTEGNYEVTVCDASNSLRRRLRNEPGLTEPRDLDGLLSLLRLQTQAHRTALYLHVPRPDRGLAVQGQSLPRLPGSARAVLSTGRQTQETAVRGDLVASGETAWVIEGSQSLKFTVVKDAGLSLR